METKRILQVLAILLVLGLLPMGKVSSQAPVRELWLLSPHQETILKEFKAAFEAYEASQGKYVQVKWVDLGGTSDIIKFIDSEFTKKTEGIGFDILWGGGVDPFIDQAEKEHLQGYQVPEEILSKVAGGKATFAGIPMYDNDAKPPRWYGTALSGFGIIYNKAVLKAENLPECKTWEDLARPEVKGWVGSADPRHSGSTHMMYEIILQAYGWEKGLQIITQLGANVKTFPASSSAVPKAVGAGDIAYGLAIDFYAWTEVNRVGADKVGYIMPEGLTVINPDSIAILKGAPNLDIAQEFVNFVLSKDGQRLWMLPAGASGGPKTYTLGRMCVIPELYKELAGKTIVPVNPFQIKTTLTYNATKGSLRYGLVNDLIGALIIDSQPDLISAWSAIIKTNQTLAKAGISSPRIREAVLKLGEAPLNEAKALNASKYWSDPAERNKYIAQWHTFAIKKYSEASSLATLAGVELVETLKTQSQANIYTGMGIGIVVGLVLGTIIVYVAMRRREIAAVKK